MKDNKTMEEETGTTRGDDSTGTTRAHGETSPVRAVEEAMETERHAVREECAQAREEEEPEEEQPSGEDKPWLASDYPTLEQCDEWLFKVKGSVLKKYLGYDAEAKIPRGITRIEKEAFAGCRTLKKIVIPDSVTSIGTNAFSGCAMLKEIFIPAEVSKIGNSAFSSCFVLKKITVDPANRMYRAMGNCLIETKSHTLIAGCLNSVIPLGVLSIAKGAFAGCIFLCELSIPASVNKIDIGAFSDCCALQKITVDPANRMYRGMGDCVLEIKSHALVVGCRNSAIPLGVTTVGTNAFCGCASLEEIAIPESVTSFGKGAFCGCEMLKQITIPASVTKIGEIAFARCGSLKELVIPSGVTKIGDMAFGWCESLEKVELAQGVKAIGLGAFMTCGALKEIFIPKSVKEIAMWAFSGCPQLTVRCEAAEKPAGWDENWNPDGRPVVWGCAK